METLKRPINVAVIGAGYWGKKVIREYIQLAKDNSEIDLSMVCDSDHEHLKFCRDALNVPEYKLVSNYTDILSSKTINAVHICTPNETHYQIGKDTLEAGKNILLEKPMTTKVTDANELRYIAKSKNLILQIGHIYRFNNTLKKMRDLLSKKYLGTLYYLKLQWTTYLPYPAKSDIIFDLAPHPVDILNYLLNDWPEKVFCKGRACRRKSLEEFAHIMMMFRNDLHASIELSWLHPGKTRLVTIIGSERSAIIDCSGQSLKIFENQDGKMFDVNVVANNTILDEINYFTRSIDTSGYSESNHYGNGASQGIKNVAILENLKKSLQEYYMIDVILDEQKIKRARD